MHKLLVDAKLLLHDDVLARSRQMDLGGHACSADASAERRGGTALDQPAYESLEDLETRRDVHELMQGKCRHR